MTRDEIVSQVNELMYTGFEIPLDKLKPEATLFDELGLDSLDAIDMLVYLEEKLHIKVQGERISMVRTLEDVYTLVAEIVPTSTKNTELSK